MSKEKVAKSHPKKKRPQETRKLLAKGYEDHAQEDLQIAKDFEAVENELDTDVDT